MIRIVLIYIAIGQLAGINAGLMTYLGPALNGMLGAGCFFFMLNSHTNANLAISSEKNTLTWLFYSGLIGMGACVATMASGNGTLLAVPKSLLFFLPWLVTNALMNSNSTATSSAARMALLLCLILYAATTLIACEYDPDVGKFYTRIAFAGLFTLSSNGISEILIISAIPLVVAAGILNPDKIYKGILMIAVVSAIHFSKAHFIAIAFAIVTTLPMAIWRSPNRRHYTFSAIAFTIPVITLLLAAVTYFPDHPSIAPLLSALDILQGSGELSTGSFSEIQGNYMRFSLYDRQFSLIAESPFLGHGDDSSRSLLDGYDYHSVYMYFWVQYGLFALVAHLCIIGALFSATKHSAFRQALIFYSTYFLIKGSVSTIDPFRFMVGCVFIYYCSTRLTYTPTANDVPSGTR